MKIYRVTHRSHDGEHDGHTYHTNKATAIKEQKEANVDGGTFDGTVEEVQIFDVPLTKDGVLAFLNTHCNYPDNG